ncbi:lipoate- ligase A [Lecanosticta acicola]|uniref:Putative lipoate-protein ligase A n=1 Tax=Lecanosticta acicola TaxID=111012 RepID=A0AAI8YZW0_9PEZI|nr:lipoate- ligase A [Lecanosticta acicola]
MIARHHLWRSAPAFASYRAPPTTARWLSSAPLDALSRPVQTYISASRDPFLNLSVEHYLLQKTAPESAVLFLYVNRPSIILGRNQNPWVEVNLALLDVSRDRPQTEPPGIGALDLVRRRSGGGTVFHDQGNVNWTVICPSAQFTRDKHAEMVVRALRSCGVARSRVNARHDIVLDQGERGAATDPEDTHCTPYEATDFDTPRPLKVSGSAYKLTRDRALHHGTCLLSSPNLQVIPDYLHSPAKPFITARGVESVSSPVGNILLSNDEFIGSVQEEFAKQYSSQGDPISLGDELLEEQSIAKGYDELKSPDWTFLQTPQFTISTRSQAVLDVDLELTVRYGAVTNASLTVDRDSGAAAAVSDLRGGIIGQKIHEIVDWGAAFGPELDKLDTWRRERLLKWLESMLPKPSH